MQESRARPLPLLHRQKLRRCKALAAVGNVESKRKGPAPDTGTGPCFVYKDEPRGRTKMRIRARMRRDERDRFAYRYNKTIARHGYRLDDHRSIEVEFLGRGKHVKGFQQA